MPGSGTIEPNSLGPVSGAAVFDLGSADEPLVHYRGRYRELR